METPKLEATRIETRVVGQSMKIEVARASPNRAAASLIVIALSFAVPVWADAPEASPNAPRGPALMVSTGVVDEALEPMAEGFAEWIRSSLAQRKN